MKVVRIEEMITILSSSWLSNKFSLSASLEMQGEQYGEYAYCSFPLLSFSQLNPQNIKSDWVVLFFVSHYANVFTGSVVIGSPLERQFLFSFFFLAAKEIHSLVYYYTSWLWFFWFFLLLNLLLAIVDQDIVRYREVKKKGMIRACV